MEQELILDVSHLPPPEPLERVLAAIDKLAAGQYVRMLHHREPFPLYAILEDTGYDFRIREGQETNYEIFIWRRNDTAAAAAVQSVTGSRDDTST
jgi:uncharacterized protein (DUF2249 family)